MLKSYVLGNMIWALTLLVAMLVAGIILRDIYEELIAGAVLVVAWLAVYYVVITRTSKA